MRHKFERDVEYKQKTFASISKALISLVVIRRVVFFVILLEAFAFFYLSKRSIILSLTMHLLIVISLIWLLTLFSSKKLDMRYLILLVLFTGTLGPPGALVILFSIILYVIYAKIVTPLKTLIGTFFPESELTESDIVYERIFYKLDEFHPGKIPIPFKDIMLFGSYQQKRISIEKMLRYFRPEFTEALLIGLNDKSNSVRVQAATALSTLDHDFFNEYIYLQNLVKKYPDDLSLLKEFGTHCDEYAASEILDPDRAKKMRESAILALEKYLQFKKEDIQVKSELGKLYLLNQEFEKAKNYLKEIIFEPDCPEIAWINLMHALYELKEFDELQKIAKERYELTSELSEEKQLKDSMFVKLWSFGVANYG